MPKKISPAIIKEWLDAYEQGESEVSIAKRSKPHHDVRTVKKSIDQARLRRDARIANVEIVKEALNKHQGQLLSCINDIFSALVEPPHDLGFQRDRYGQFVPIQLSAASATCDNQGSWKIILDAEGCPQWELLREHLRGERLWPFISKWQNALAAHIGSRIAFNGKVTTILEQKTGYKLKRNIGDIPQEGHLLPVGIVFFYQIELDRALAIPTEKYTYLDKCIVDDTCGYLKVMPGDIPLAYVPGSKEECKKAMLEACEDIRESKKEVNTLWSTYKELKEHTIKARKAVEEISLLGLVPGTCRICRRLGI